MTETPTKQVDVVQFTKLETAVRAARAAHAKWRQSRRQPDLKAYREAVAFVCVEADRLTVGEENESTGKAA